MFDKAEPREMTTQEKATWKELAERENWPTKLATMAEVLAERDTIKAVDAKSGNYQRRFRLAKRNQDVWKTAVQEKLKDKVLLKLKHKLRTIWSVYFDIFQSPHIYGAA